MRTGCQHAFVDVADLAETIQMLVGSVKASAFFTVTETNTKSADRLLLELDENASFSCSHVSGEVRVPS